MRYLFLAALIFSLVHTASIASWAAAPDGAADDSRDTVEIKKDLEELKREVLKLKKEMRDLKGLVKSRPKPTARAAGPVRGKTGIKGDPSMGSADAPLVLVEFSDYQCPYCSRYTKNTFPLIKRDYIDTGKIKYVFKDFPLPFHKQARKAAEAAHCASEEGKYWGMHDLIFDNQAKMDEKSLVGHAEKLGLKVSDFKRCLEDGRYSKGLDEDIAAGRSSGVTGTPSFLLGRLNDKNEVEGSVIKGARPFEVFKSEIEAKLKAKN